MIPKKIKRTALGATLVAGLIGLSSCGTTTPEPPMEDSSKAVADMSSAPTTASYSKPKSTKVASTPSKPESTPSTPTKPTPPAPTPSVVAGKTHLVIKGETLWDIARQYAPAKNYDTLETYVSAARKLN